MKLVKLVAAAILFPLLCSADETDQQPKLEQSINRHINHKSGLRAYNITTINPPYRFVTGSNRAHEFKFTEYFHPSIAFQIASKRQNFHEIELTDFTYKKTKDLEYALDTDYFRIPVQGEEIIRSSLAARYEFIRPLIKGRDARLVPAIGVAGMAYFERIATVPLTTSLFPSRYAQFGARGFLVPRVTWYASKRVYVDINIPLPLLDMGLNMRRVGNPAYPAPLRDYNLIVFNAIPNYYTFRAGVGVKL